jgi:hypothetical protein
MKRKFIILAALWLFGAGIANIYAQVCYDSWEGPPTAQVIPCDKETGENGDCYTFDGDLDEDCDGIANAFDQCPNLWGLGTNDLGFDGCPNGVTPGACEDCYNDGGVPIGSGLLFLLGGMAAYGFSLFRRRKNNKI